MEALIVEALRAAMREAIAIDPTISQLKDIVHEHGLKLEDIQTTCDKILEVMSPLIEKSERIDHQAKALRQCEDDLVITKQTLKGHITNKRIHRADR